MSTSAEDLIRVGITYANANPILIKLDQKKPLAAFIEHICEEWKLQNPDNYSLRFETDKIELTERNRGDIKVGAVLELVDSPVKQAQNIADILENGPDSKRTDVLLLLSRLSDDSKFAANFASKSSVPILIKMIQSGTTSDRLGNLLSSFCSLMSHDNLVAPEQLDETFIAQVALNVCKVTGVEVRELQASLGILENIVIAGSSNVDVIEKLVDIGGLVAHLNSKVIAVQKNTIALINALYAKADPARQKEYTKKLKLKDFREVLLSITRGKCSPEMQHQLYITQSFIFNFLQEDMMTPVNLNSNVSEKKLNSLRQNAFDSDPDSISSTNTKRRSHLAEYKKLGFENCNDPLQDFTAAPPGTLALNTLLYFSQQHTEDYSKIVLENSCRTDDHDLPFVKACISLTDLLCNILHIGEQASNGTDGKFFPMFFTTDHPFEDLFCHCVGLMNKTWKEMRATSADFSKVMSVVKEQIVRSLEDRHNNYDQFKVKLAKLTYAEITNIWHEERKHQEEWASQAKPIRDLRDHLKPEIIELIKLQRLNFMIEGTCFLQFPNHKRGKGADKYWYCKLTPNHKALIYCECSENGDISPDRPEKKLCVEDFKCVVLGRDCPHVKETAKKLKGGGDQHKFAFSILTEREIEVVGEKESQWSLDFIAPTQNDFDKWLDGLNALLQKPMTSPGTAADMDMLLNMEIKLRLLDTEGINIPENPPAIPADPPDYNYCYSV